MESVYDALRALTAALECKDKKAAEDELYIESLKFRLKETEAERDRYKQFYEAVHKEALA